LLVVLSTTELLDAAAEALDAEACEISRPRRALMLAWTRATLAQWRCGALTIEQAVANLRSCGARLAPTRSRAAGTS
jgi:hypothetical protein